MSPSAECKLDQAGEMPTRKGTLVYVAQVLISSFSFINFPHTYLESSQVAHTEGRKTVSRLLELLRKASK